MHSWLLLIEARGGVEEDNEEVNCSGAYRVLVTTVPLLLLGKEGKGECAEGERTRL